MEKVLVVYWSGTGNTEAMANAIADGVKAAGAEVDVMHVSENPSLSDYTKIAFGCPAMGAEELEESEFEPYFSSVEGDLSGKKVALFGSYDWGSGDWMQTWQDRVSEAGATLFKEGLTVNLTPDDDALATCEEFGKEFANS